MRLSLLGMVIALGGLLLAACSPNKATPENYAKLDWTLSREQAYQLLGQPTSVTRRDTDPAGDTTTEIWDGPNHEAITITFVNDKVAMKTMHSDGKDY